MKWDDFLPFENFESAFEQIRDYNISTFNQNIKINLHFSDIEKLNAGVKPIKSTESEITYHLIINKRLIQLVSRYFFVLARCIPSINDVEIQNNAGPGIDAPFSFELEKLESKLNQMPYDLELDEGRFEIFEFMLRTAWDIILLHEFAHITCGHVDFFQDNREEVESNPAYSRACEFEADDKSSLWLAQRQYQYPPVWMHSTDEADGHGTAKMRIIATVAFCLFQTIQMHSVTLPYSSLSTYPPIDVRSAIFANVSLNQAVWNNKQSMIEAYAKAWADATNYMLMVSSRKEPKIPTFLSNIPLEETPAILNQVANEYKNLRHRWYDYRPLPL